MGGCLDCLFIFHAWGISDGRATPQGFFFLSFFCSSSFTCSQCLHKLISRQVHDSISADLLMQSLSKLYLSRATARPLHLMYMWWLLTSYLEATHRSRDAAALPPSIEAQMIADASECLAAGVKGEPALRDMFKAMVKLGDHAQMVSLFSFGEASPIVCDLLCEASRDWTTCAIPQAHISSVQCLQTVLASSAGLTRLDLYMCTGIKGAQLSSLLALPSVCNTLQFLALPALSHAPVLCTPLVALTELVARKCAAMDDELVVHFLKVGASLSFLPLLLLLLLLHARRTRCLLFLRRLI